MVVDIRALCSSADGPVRVTMWEAGELEIGRVDVELLQNPFDSSRVEILLNRRDPCSHSKAVMRALALLLVERPRKIALSAGPLFGWMSDCGQVDAVGHGGKCEVPVRSID